MDGDISPVQRRLGARVAILVNYQCGTIRPAVMSGGKAIPKKALALSREYPFEFANAAGRSGFELLERFVDET
jgi:hypothetical protein